MANPATIQNSNSKSKNFFKELMHSQHSTGLRSSSELKDANERYYQEVLITPELAKELLAKNFIDNRKLRDPKIAQFVRDMKEGKWKRGTAEVIKVGKSGNLLDGQHRLVAVIKSQTSVWNDFCFNVDDDNFDVLDTGSSRTSNDIFRTQNIKYYALLPGVIQQYNVLINGATSVRGASKNKVLTNSALLKVYFSNEDYWQKTASLVTSWYQTSQRILNKTILGGFFAFFETLDEEKAFKFFEQLCKPIYPDHEVVLMLKNKLMQDKAAPKKMSAFIKYGLLIKAWNHYRSGTPCKQLKFDYERENMPIAK